MGELRGTEIDRSIQDRNKEQFGTEENPNGYPTDVEGLFADDIIKKGNEEFPVFHVTKEEFFSNMQANRKRIRFKNDSKAKIYMQKTRNGGRPFYIKTKDGEKEYVRKLK